MYPETSRAGLGRISRHRHTTPSPAPPPACCCFRVCLTPANFGDSNPLGGLLARSRIRRTLVRGVPRPVREWHRAAGRDRDVDSETVRHSSTRVDNPYTRFFSMKLRPRAAGWLASQNAIGDCRGLKGAAAQHALAGRYAARQRQGVCASVCRRLRRQNGAQALPSFAPLRLPRGGRESFLDT